MHKKIIRNIVTGGAGFLGSHLIDRLIENGEEVICLDNFFTGHKSNIINLFNNPRFEFIRHDITKPILLEADRIFKHAWFSKEIECKNFFGFNK